MSKLKEGIKYLEKYNQVKIPNYIQGFDAFRALMNITMTNDLNDDFYLLQDEIIKNEYQNKQITSVEDLTPIQDNIYLWQGDITTLKVDAIVNACNSDLLGCFHPLHKCIDNAIHSFAGLQVRRDLKVIMDKQGYREPNGKAKITKGYNLPAKYILHTVGPKVNGKITKENESDLYNCYISCLKLADTYSLKSIAFCSISAGLYGYPIDEASKIALKAVRDYFKANKSKIEKIIFNVFSGDDYDVYFRTIKKAN